MAFLVAHNVDPGSTSDMYVLCAYFVCTVLTTTGFGDVTAEDYSERIFMILLMACASLLFGLVLGEAQELLAVANARAREREERVEATAAFLRESGVPHAAARRVSEWVRFHYPGARADRQCRDVLATLPSEIREEVAGAFSAGLLGRVPLLGRIPDDENHLRSRFVAALLPSLASAFFLRGTALARRGERADRVFIVCSGTVAARLPPPGGRPATEAPALLLRARDSFGDHALLGDPRWGGVFGVDTDFVAVEDVRVVSLDVAAALRTAADPAFAGVRQILTCFAYEAEREDDREGWRRRSIDSDLATEPEEVAFAEHVVAARQARAVCRWIRTARARLRGAPLSADIWAHSAAWLHLRAQKAMLKQQRHGTRC